MVVEFEKEIEHWRDCRRRTIELLTKITSKGRSHEPALDFDTYQWIELLRAELIALEKLIESYERPN
jgi:hypothetical protein